MENRRGREGGPMNTYYVSLTRDLLGCYLQFTAATEGVLRKYLSRTYQDNEGHWELPWCSIYMEIPQIDRHNHTIIVASCGPLFERAA